mmetsp:Transcript_17933/g.38703  ORF Transcript_17933/g.38703 Transcript_17933/m.38703 type:complete len:120 (-) Transcript_17933:250-609(-)
MLPCSKTTTLFTPSDLTTPSLCVTINIHRVLSIADLRASTTTFSLLESSAAVGSSSNNTSGNRTRALAIATLCLCPPESVLPPSPTLVSSSNPKSLFSPVTGNPANDSASVTAKRYFSL